VVFGEFFEVVEVSGQPSQVHPATVYIDLAAFAGTEVVPVGGFDNIPQSFTMPCLI